MAARKRVYFISDIHLGATYEESARVKEQRVADFLRSIKDDASDLYLLGDILDYWFEYRTVVPRGYIRFFGALAELADAGVRIKWIIGNHDIWLFDYLRDEIGLEVLDGVVEEEILGRKFVMAHGDGVGKMKRSFRFIRSVFRNRVCQKLYASIHPRWTIPFAHRWSSHSRCSEAVVGWRGEEETLMAFALTALEANPEIDYFVFGHRHLMINEKIGPHTGLIVLGDWLTNYSYGRFDGEKFELLTIK